MGSGGGGGLLKSRYLVFVLGVLVFPPALPDLRVGAGSPGASLALSTAAGRCWPLWERANLTAPLLN